MSPGYRKRIACLLLAPCLLSAAGHAAVEPRWTEAQASAALYAAAQSHRKDFGDLMGSRGLSFEDGELESLEAIERDGIAGLATGNAGSRDTAVVFYHHDGEYLQAWAAAGAKYAWERQRIGTDDLASRVAAIHAQLRVPGSNRGVQREDVDDAGTVPASDPRAIERASAWLFPGDIDTVLREPGVRRIVIVPWGPLGSVPFSVLPRAGRGGKVLADTFAVSVAPGLNDLYRAPVYRARVPKEAIVIGNPAFGPDTGLAPLPGAEREAIAVAQLFGVPAYVAEHANLSDLQDAMGSAELLYFATHGIVDPADPLDGAYLAFAGDGPAARWTARDIQYNLVGLRSGAVVVMSACDTGRGAVQRAGVIGLARAFQLAGAAEVVMSLWPVDDEATAQLMPRFAALLREGRTADEALQQAMREQRARTPDPARWGAFTVFSRPVILR